jgi:hypothetical protein
MIAKQQHAIQRNTKQLYSPQSFSINHTKSTPIEYLIVQAINVGTFLMRSFFSSLLALYVIVGDLGKRWF